MSLLYMKLWILLVERGMKQLCGLCWVSCYISVRLGIWIDCVCKEKHICCGNALGIELGRVGMCVL